jgi:hypothetical protein
MTGSEEEAKPAPMRGRPIRRHLRTRGLARRRGSGHHRTVASLLRNVLPMLLATALVACGAPAEGESVDAGAGGPDAGAPPDGGTPDAGEHLPVLEGLGVTFAAYDATTGNAGDFRFAGATERKLFSEFPAVVSRPDGSPKDDPVFTYLVPPETPIRSVSSAFVTAAEYQPDSDDFEIRLQTDPASPWVVVVDHVRAPAVVKGQFVLAGDLLGTAGSFRDGLGRTELMVVDGATGTAWCPTRFLAADVAAGLGARVRRLMRDWEDFRGDPALYDDGAMATPGCLRESLLLGP